MTIPRRSALLIGRRRERAPGEAREVRLQPRARAGLTFSGSSAAAPQLLKQRDRRRSSARSKRETTSHTRDNGPEKGVLSLVELTLRARSSALEAKATEARQRRGAELEAITQTRGA